MNFKLYDILSSVVPGFLMLIALLIFFDHKFDKDLLAVYTTFSFLLGYLITTISSWLEGFYFITWGGKPSDSLLSGKDIWKVKFYDSLKVKSLLQKETSNASASNDELFSIAMRYANNEENRIEDFNSSYAFSRSLLTCVIIGGAFVLIRNYSAWQYYVTVLPTVFIVWLRCKQKGYYYAREVLNFYLKSKTV